MVGAENVSRRNEFRTQTGVVVHLAVVGDPDTAILVRHRLVGQRAQINDREASMSETHRAVFGDPAIAAVGPAMHHRVTHTAKHGRGNRSAFSISEYANN